MKDFLKTLWDQKYEDNWGNEEHANQWWMISVALAFAFLVLIVAIAKFSWVIAGAIGAAGWEYKDQILEFVTKEKKDRSD